MIKRIVVVLFLLGFSGCVLPDYKPPATNEANQGTPTITPVLILTPKTEATGNVPEQPGTVTETPNTGENTPQATSTPHEETTRIPEVVPTPYVYTLYLLQSGSPTWVENFLHPEAACNWMGVGGQIFDLHGNAVPNLVVRLTGTLNGEPVDLIALTGGALNLGPGGYEFKLSDHPITSNGTILVSVTDQDGNAVSDSVPISTSDACDKNIVLVNFSEGYVIENGIKIYLPFITLMNNP